ncbi:methyltransferase, partial [Alphaproteobacteria bacterium]|nr:methyltransferase [Alphaproteobacteria bacterium]
MTDKPLAEDTETSDDSFLNGQIQVRQPRSGYRIGTDAVMVAATIQMKAGRLLDMGAGVGGISLAIAHRLADAQITAAEIDPVNYALLSHNIGINQQHARIRPLRADILSLPPVMAGSFDHVVSNPPFHHASDAPSRSRRRTLAHYETDARLGEWVDAGLAALKPKGRLTM